MKKNIYFIALLLTFSSCSYSQQKEYTNIPRTRVSIQIPDGYKIMESSTGLQKGRGEQMIMIVDNIEGNFYTNAKKIKKSSFEKTGIKVFEYKETTVDGYPAKYVMTSTEQIELRSIMMVFGDSTFSTMVNSIHLGSNENLEEEIKNTIFSIQYDINKKVNPFENVKFTIDTISTDFKLGGFSANLYMFTPFGNKQSDEKAAIMVTPTLFDNSINIDDLSIMLQNSVEKYGMYGCISENKKKYTIENNEALLNVGDCFSGTDKMYYHNLVLVKDDYCLMIYGSCKFENEKFKSQIKQFCNNIRIRN